MKAVSKISQAVMLFAISATLSIHAIAQDGPISGTTSPSPAPAATPASGDSKPLPWKFLAKPNGVLDSSKWSDEIRKLNCDQVSKCPLPDDKQINALFEATIGALPKKTPVYVIMHVVEHPDNQKTASTSAKSGIKVKSDHWYLYRSQKGRYGDPKWTYEKFTGQRIYGSSSAFFLFLDLNAGAVTLDKATKQAKRYIDVAEKLNKNTCDKDDECKKTASSLNTNVIKNLKEFQGSNPSDEHVSNLIVSKGFTPPGSDTSKTLPFCVANGDHLDWSTQDGISSTYQRIRYEAAVAKRTPANIANLQAIIGLIFKSANAKADCLQLAANDIVWGGGRIDNIGLPSDISIAGYSVDTDDAVNEPVAEAERSSRQIGSVGSYNDEQLYLWDASIGIPVHKIKDLQYSDSDNTVTATKVDKQTAYAMFNLMLRPTDLSSPKANVWPRVLVGFPLSSSPWDSLFAGGGIGLPWKPFQNFQFFAGATFLRTKTPSTLAAGQAANNSQLQNDLNIKTTRKLTVGINVPVKSVIDKLK